MHVIKNERFTSICASRKTGINEGQFGYSAGQLVLVLVNVELSVVQNVRSSVFGFISMGQSLSWLYPSSVPRLYTVTSKVQLNVKRANSNTETEPLSIAGFIQSRVPSLCSQFTPAWWLPKYASSLPELLTLVADSLNFFLRIVDTCKPVIV